MKIISMLQMQYRQFEEAVQGYLARMMNRVSYKYSNSSIFGQMMTVFGSAVQNILSYIEDSLTEQNKYTASRKRSIYNLAAVSGYFPHLGTATTASLELKFKPNNNQISDITIPNHTRISCSQNGCTYNVVLPQEAVVLSPRLDNTTKYITIVEGTFENQTYIATGGDLYTINVPFSSDCDIDYLTVQVNGVLWERRASLYDMDPLAEQYMVNTSLKKGFDIIFGNGQYGKPLKDNDRVYITYLLHNGEHGNISVNEPVDFAFGDPLQDTLGNDIDGNEVFSLTLMGAGSVNSGTFSEDMLAVREMIGMNSRSLVLADPKNYKQYLSRFSFCGYNRTWSEPGSLIINSLIMNNFKQKMSDGLDYFALQESDFYLSSEQKRSVINHINKTGQQLAGAVFNIFDPEIVKYAMYMYIHPKSDTYDTTYMTSQIRKLVGGFFADIKSDIFVPKSDIVHLIKNNMPDVDGVDVYFLSEHNEQALKDGHYTDKTYNYDPSTGTYRVTSEEVYLYDGENPNIGLDSHGNIYLDNTDQFPVLMGGWSFISSQPGEARQLTTVTDPLVIIYE